MNRKIKNIALINPSTNTKYKDYINYIDTSAVNDGKLSETYYLEKDYPSRAQRKLMNNDILISSVRPNLKHNYFVNSKLEHLIGSTGFIQVRVIDNRFIPKYIYYYLTSESKINLYTSIANFNQTAYPSFNKDVIENIEINDIAVDKQQHIVNIM